MLGTQSDGVEPPNGLPAWLCLQLTAPLGDRSNRENKFHTPNESVTANETLALPGLLGLLELISAIVG